MSQSQSIGCVKQERDDNCKTTKIVTRILFNFFGPLAISNALKCSNINCVLRMGYGLTIFCFFLYVQCLTSATMVQIRDNKCIVNYISGQLLYLYENELCYLSTVPLAPLIYHPSGEQTKTFMESHELGESCCYFPCKCDTGIRERLLEIL